MSRWESYLLYQPVKEDRVWFAGLPLLRRRKEVDPRLEVAKAVGESARVVPHHADNMAIFFQASNGRKSVGVEVGGSKALFVTPTEARRSLAPDIKAGLDALERS